MTKNIMSIAAAAAILASGAIAFETTDGTFEINSTAKLPQGTLLNINMELGDYNTPGLAAPAPLTVDLDKEGDALIFPAFNIKDQWGTEIVVRNNQDHAVVAKFVAYSGADSQELVDFNIYLSANDVFRCNIQDGAIKSTDDSVNVGNGWGVLDIALPEHESTGYVVVYGMAAAKTVDWHAPDAAANAAILDPKDILKESYTSVLNQLRTGWDDHAMDQGVYIREEIGSGVYRAPMTSPKLLTANQDALLCEGIAFPENAAIGTFCPINANMLIVPMSDPDENTLSGTVRIYNADEPRDLLMPATSMNNYTDGFMMLWAPRELAAWADRNIVNNATATADIYDAGLVLADAQAYDVKDAFYTFNNEAGQNSSDLQNKLIVTQPQKRTVVQLGNGAIFWSKTTQCEVYANLSGAEISGDLENGTDWGLVYGATIWDEEENKIFQEQNPEVSPGGTEARDAMCPEVGELVDLEVLTDMAEKNGYAKVRFLKSAPAIISQMSASSIGNERRINWIPVSGNQL